MLRFRRLVYLDVQKTGSTQLEALLEEALGEAPRERRRHAPVARRRRGAVHVISTRSPWELYRSLYRYGVDERGMAYRRIRDAGHAAVYRDFETWLDLALDPARADLVEGHWARSGTAGFLGLMGFRYARLALPAPDARLPRVHDLDQLDAALARHGLDDEVIENARLESDLLDVLARNAARLRLDPAALPALAERWRAAERRNTSSVATEEMSPEAIARIAERESWLIGRFGYEPPTVPEARIT